MPTSPLSTVQDFFAKPTGFFFVPRFTFAMSTVSTSSLPRIVIVAGAFHSVSVFQSVTVHATFVFVWYALAFL